VTALDGRRCERPDGTLCRRNQGRQSGIQPHEFAYVKTAGGLSRGLAMSRSIAALDAQWSLSMSVVVALPCGCEPTATQAPCRTHVMAFSAPCWSGALVCAGVRGVDARLQPDPFQRVTSGAARDCEPSPLL
jgi:hypothetical protein